MALPSYVHITGLHADRSGRIHDSLVQRITAEVESVLGRSGEPTTVRVPTRELLPQTLPAHARASRHPARTRAAGRHLTVPNRRRAVAGVQTAQPGCRPGGDQAGQKHEGDCAQESAGGGAASHDGDPRGARCDPWSASPQVLDFEAARARWYWYPDLFALPDPPPPPSYSDWFGQMKVQDLTVGRLMMWLSLNPPLGVEVSGA